MNQKEKLIEWRSEEIAKILLRKSSFQLSIEQFPTPIFDLFITQLNQPKYRFAVEVKSGRLFTKRVNHQLSSLIKYRDAGMINIPVLLMKIDESKETGEIDFLVVPSISNKLLIRKKFSFKPANKDNLDIFISRINLWWDQQ